MLRLQAKLRRTELKSEEKTTCKNKLRIKREEKEGFSSPVQDAWCHGALRHLAHRASNKEAASRH